MSISAIYILDLLGKPLIFRNYRHTHESEVIDKFMAAMMDQEEDRSLTPVLQVNGVTFAFIKYKNVYVVSTTSRNANISLVFAFLYKVVQVMKDYFKEVEEESIRDNFVVLYELLDEILDFGYPQITESSILLEYITQESNKLESRRTIPPAVTNAVSWRSSGLKYKKNEVFLDVVESIDLVAKSNGSVIRSEIVGSVKVRCQLSGMPELRLGLNDRLVCENDVSGDYGNYVDLDEVKFHQCVRLSNFETDRSITFVPPDGEFELMSYRINTYVKPPIWVDCVTMLCPNRRVEYTVKVTSHFKSRLSASFVHILIPVPSDVDSPKFQYGVGSVTYIPENNILNWSIKGVSGCKEYFMIAKFGLPSVANGDREGLPPIQVKFDISLFNISGVHVRYLKIIEKSGYQSLPWVRYTTRNGDYQIRQRERLQLKPSLF